LKQATVDSSQIFIGISLFVMKSPISSDAVENVGGNRDVEGMAKK
jgi:hypothetical protein